MTRKILQLIFICILVSITIYRLTSTITRAPARWDEQTNIAVVDETIARHSFPYLYYQNKPFFEKPPLWYWINICIGTVAGVTPITMRFLTILSGLGIILLSSSIAWRLWGNSAGVVTWIVLLFSYQLFVPGAGGYFATHTFDSADLDALQILCILIAYIAFIRLKKPHMVFLGSIATASAVLTKGPLGFLPLIIATFLYLSSHRKELLQTWILTLFLILPWYAFMYASFGSTFLSTHIGYHVINRIFVPLEGHRSSPLFFVELLTNMQVYPIWPIVAGSIIWSIVHIQQRHIFYLFVLTITFLLFPTIADTRLAWYILPFYPFAALLAGAATNTLLLKLHKT